MRKEWASILIGIGVDIIATVFQVVLKNIPMPITITLGVMGLALILYGVISIIRNKKTASGLPQDISESPAGRDIYQAGRDIIVNAPPEASPQDIPWTNRPDGPQFKLSPGIHNGRLLCEFRISNASPVPGGVEARWVGPGINQSWTKPMPQNVPRGSFIQSYQMKAVSMNPTPPKDEATFEIQFYLNDGLHGGRWVWPMHQHEKGHWILDSHEGSRVFQPNLEDIW